MAERLAAAKAGRWGLIDALKLIGAARVPRSRSAICPESAQRDYDSTWGHNTSFERDAPTKT